MKSVHSNRTHCNDRWSRSLVGATPLSPPRSGARLRSRAQVIIIIIISIVIIIIIIIITIAGPHAPPVLQSSWVLTNLSAEADYECIVQVVIDRDIYLHISTIVSIQCSVAANCFPVFLEGYYFVAQAHNRHGWSSPSPIYVFQTGEEGATGNT